MKQMTLKKLASVFIFLTSCILVHGDVITVEGGVNSFWEEKKREVDSVMQNALDKMSENGNIEIDASQFQNQPPSQPQPVEAGPLVTEGYVESVNPNNSSGDFLVESSDSQVQVMADDQAKQPVSESALVVATPEQGAVELQDDSDTSPVQATSATDLAEANEQAACAAVVATPAQQCAEAQSSSDNSQVQAVPVPQAEQPVSGVVADDEPVRVFRAFFRAWAQGNISEAEAYIEPSNLSFAQRIVEESDYTRVWIGPKAYIKGEVAYIDYSMGDTKSFHSRWDAMAIKRDGRWLIRFIDPRGSSKMPEEVRDMNSKYGMGDSGEKINYILGGKARSLAVKVFLPAYIVDFK